MADRPDIYLILFDGLPGTAALEEVYGREAGPPGTPALQLLEAWAAYPMTLASVASVFEMGYPVVANEVIDATKSDALARVMSGDNRLLEFLKEQGYQIHYAESGYSRSYCSETVDVCVASHFLDEGTFGILGQTVPRRLLVEQFGSSYAANGLSRAQWLRKYLPELGRDDKPDFVFANIGVPHPPLILDHKCRTHYDAASFSATVFAGPASVEQRRVAFLEQAECARLIEADLANLVPDDAVTIFFSDHGGDSLGQMSYLNREWSTEAAIERMSSHLSQSLAVEVVSIPSPSGLRR